MSIGHKYKYTNTNKNMDYLKGSKSIGKSKLGCPKLTENICRDLMIVRSWF